MKSKQFLFLAFILLAVPLAKAQSKSFLSDFYTLYWDASANQWGDTNVTATMTWNPDHSPKELDVITYYPSGAGGKDIYKDFIKQPSNMKDYNWNFQRFLHGYMYTTHISMADFGSGFVNSSMHKDSFPGDAWVNTYYSAGTGSFKPSTRTTRYGGWNYYEEVDESYYNGSWSVDSKGKTVFNRSNGKINFVQFWSLDPSGSNTWELEETQRYHYNAKNEITSTGATYNPSSIGPDSADLTWLSCDTSIQSSNYNTHFIGGGLYTSEIQYVYLSGNWQPEERTTTSFYADSTLHVRKQESYNSGTYSNDILDSFTYYKNKDQFHWWNYTGSGSSWSKLGESNYINTYNIYGDISKSTMQVKDPSSSKLVNNTYSEYHYSIYSGFQESKAAINTIKVFPNPAQAYMTFDLGEERVRTLSILNMQGQIVKSISEPRGQYTWNFNENSGNTVSKGMYFYSITTDGNVFSGKIVKE